MPTRVRQNSSVPGAGTSMTVTLPATTAGNLVVVAWLQNVDQVINSVTDTAGNTYSLAVSRFAGGASGIYSVYYKENAAGIGSTNTITIAFAGDAGGGEAVAAEWSGIATSGSLDTTKTATGTTANPSSGSFTTATDNELLFAFVGCVLATENYTAGSGYTAVAQPDGYTQSEEQLTNTAGAGKTATFTGGATTWGVVAVAFKAAGTVFNDTTTLSTSLAHSATTFVGFNPNVPLAAFIDYHLRGSGVVSNNGGFEKTAFENTAFYVLLGNSYSDSIALALTTGLSDNYALTISPSSVFNIVTGESTTGQLNAVASVTLHAAVSAAIVGNYIASLVLPALSITTSETNTQSLNITTAQTLSTTLSLAILGGKDVFAAMSAAITAAISDDRTVSISSTVSFAITLNAIISAVLDMSKSVTFAATVLETSAAVLNAAASEQFAVTLNEVAAGTLNINATETLTASLSAATLGGFIFSSTVSLPASLVYAVAAAFTYTRSANFAVTSGCTTADTLSAGALVTFGITAGYTLAKQLSAVGSAQFALTTNETSSAAGSVYGVSIPLALTAQVSDAAQGVFNGLLSMGIHPTLATAAVNVIVQAITLGITTGMSDDAVKNALQIAALLAEAVSVVQQLTAANIEVDQRLTAEAVANVQRLTAELTQNVQQLTAESVNSIA
jgi:hypothetical protein